MAATCGYDTPGHEPQEAEIEVRDDGTGIAPEVLPQIFEPFLTTKEASHGVGLGLAISTPSSSGTTAVLKSNRSWAKARASPWLCHGKTRAWPRSRRGVGRKAGRRDSEVMNVSTQGKMLIVDDELSVRDSLGKWFREEGYEVALPRDASDALTRLAEQRWDVALVDIKMHGTDGIEFQRRMHEIDPELIVIMMTGYASVETAVTALKNGAYDYVTKPLDPDEIAHLVKNALAHKRTENENVLLRETVAEVARPEDIIGQSGSCARCLTRSRRLARPMRPCWSPARAAPAKNWWRAPSMPPAREDFIRWWPFIAAR